MPQDLRDDARHDYYARLGAHALGALWTILEDTLTPSPRPRAVPRRWRWDTVRPLLYQAADLVTADEAERRVLMLLNPGLGGDAAVAETLYAGIQIIRPGEVARTHRHTPNALRFIMEGTGAFTTVNGERTVMQRGDFVLTPTWTWHDHGNEGTEAVVWLDGLDLPLVTGLAAMFAEPYTARQQPVTRPPDDSRTRWGTGFRPAWISSTPEYSPLLSYPYHAARAALERVATNDGGSPFDGVLMEYMNPLTGGSVLPTMDAYLQRVPAATVLATHRHTSATVYLGVEGSGIVDIDGEPYPWEPNDVIVVPSWASHRHRNPGREAAVLFSFSNAPLLKKMGLYREEAVSDAP